MISPSDRQRNLRGGSASAGRFIQQEAVVIDSFEVEVEYNRNFNGIREHNYGARPQSPGRMFYHDVTVSNGIQNDHDSDILMEDGDAEIDTHNGISSVSSPHLRYTDTTGEGQETNGFDDQEQDLIVLD